MVSHPLADGRLVAEVVLTGFLRFVILGATDGLGPPGFAPIPIGLGLTLIHLMASR